jgi:hypothetical protein
VEVYLHAFLTSALDGVSGQLNASAALLPGKETLVTHSIRGLVGPRASLDAVYVYTHTHIHMYAYTHTYIHTHTHTHARARAREAKSKTKENFRKNIYCKYTGKKLVLLFNVIPHDFNAPVPASHTFLIQSGKVLWLRL